MYVIFSAKAVEDIAECQKARLNREETEALSGKDEEKDVIKTDVSGSSSSKD